MASVLSRRPVPALIALVALIVLAGLVWWRVINRDSTTATEGKGNGCPTASASASPSGAARSTPAAKPPTVLPQPKNVTVEILNSTTRSGIAGKAQQKLIKAGFNSPDPAGNDDKHQGKIKGVARIRYVAKDVKGAELLRYYFPHAQLVRVSHGKQVIVSLGDKYKHVADTKKVAKAMKKDNVVIAGSQKQDKPKGGSRCSTPTPTPSGTASST